jgi:DNA-3-methyladenine glycosylase II
MVLCSDLPMPASVAHFVAGRGDDMGAPPWQARAMRTALAHLRRVDPLLAGLIARVGPCRLAVDRAAQPYAALLRAVAYQQLHAAAAQAIFGRFLAGFPAGEFPAPEAVAAAPAELFRTAGFSARKEAAIRDIAAPPRACPMPP